MECSPYVLAATLAAHLQAHLAATRGGVPDRVAVYPHADPAVEFGCDMAWVGIGRVTPVPAGRCTNVWSLDLTAGVSRCYPVVDGNGAPPVPSVDSAARDVLDDGEAMRRAVLDAFDDDEVKIEGWSTTAPQGGAHTSRMTLTVTMSWGAFVEPGSPKLDGDPRG